MRWWVREPAILLGATEILGLVRWPLYISKAEAFGHMHVLGKTGSGKSYFLAGLFLSLYEAGLPVTLVDPHGTLSKFVLSHLVEAGYYKDPEQYNRLLYLDIPAAMDAKRYLPFNYLKQPYEDHAIGEFVTDAFKRAFPELAEGAPTFTNILKHAIIVLRQNNLPLTALSDLLTDREYRNQLLTQVSDAQAVRFFQNRMDQWGRDEADKKESTLNRIDLLTYAPFMKHSLGFKENFLNFREILEEGRSVIINLAVPEYPDASQLFGCLLTVGLEQAAKARSRLDEEEVRSRPSHHLIIDEFSLYTGQSAKTLTRMLSETRKFRLFCVLAHQNWSQTDERLQGALQNVELEFIFRAGRNDAEHSARLMAWVDPMAVKHEIGKESGGDHTHPTYFQLQEQWERHTQRIQYLRQGHALARLPDDSIHKVHTRTLPPVRVSRDELTKVRETYLKRFFLPAPTSRIKSPVIPTHNKPSSIRRRPAG
jgi:Helicase HerA, central domain